MPEIQETGSRGLNTNNRNNSTQRASEQTFQIDPKQSSLENAQRLTNWLQDKIGFGASVDIQATKSGTLNISITFGKGDAAVALSGSLTQDGKITFARGADGSQGVRFDYGQRNDYNGGTAPNIDTFIKQGENLYVVTSNVNNRNQLTDADGGVVNNPEDAKTIVRFSRSGITDTLTYEAFNGRSYNQALQALGQNSAAQTLLNSSSPAAGSGTLSLPVAPQLPIRPEFKDSAQFAPMVAAFNQLLQELGTPNGSYQLPPNAPRELRELLSVANKNFDSAAEYIQSIAQKGGVDRVNKFLKDNGFSIQLRPGGENDIAVASRLDVKVDWQNPGTETRVTLESGKAVDAAMLKGGFSVLTNKNGEKVVEVSTTSGEKVYFKPISGPMPDGSDPVAVAKLVGTSRDGLLRDSQNYSSFIFPQTDYTQAQKIDSIIGTRFPDGSRITQAVSENKFKVNHLGAHAQNAVAAMLGRGLSLGESFTINGSYLVWIEKEGSTVFSAAVGENSFKKPNIN